MTPPRMTTSSSDGGHNTDKRDRAGRLPRGWWLAPLLGLSACLQIAIAFGRFW